MGNKLWVFAENPLTQAGVAVIVSAIGIFWGFPLLLIVGWLLLCLAVFRTKFFEGKKWRLFGDAAICVLLGLALAWLDRRMSYPKTPEASASMGVVQQHQGTTAEPPPQPNQPEQKPLTNSGTAKSMPPKHHTPKPTPEVSKEDPKPCIPNGTMSGVKADGNQAGGIYIEGVPCLSMKDVEANKNGGTGITIKGESAQKPSPLKPLSEPLFGHRLPPEVEEEMAAYRQVQGYASNSDLPWEATFWINQRLNERGFVSFKFAMKVGPAPVPANCNTTAMDIGEGATNTHVNGMDVNMPNCGKGIVMHGSEGTTIENYTFTQDKNPAPPTEVPTQQPPK